MQFIVALNEIINYICPIIPRTNIIKNATLKLIPMLDMIFLPASQAEEILEKAVLKGLEAFEIRRKRLEDVKLLTINEVARRLHKSHATVKKLCLSGVIKTTKSGLIEESSIEEYLRGN